MPTMLLPPDPSPHFSLVGGVVVLLQYGGAVFFESQGVLTISGSSFNSNTGGGEAVYLRRVANPQFYTNEEANAAFGPASG